MSEFVNTYLLDDSVHHMIPMDRKEFYEICWDLNKQRIVTGGKSASVAYVLDDELKFSADMDFYPVFHKEKIYEMPVVIGYANWAPWNKEASADSLQLDVVNMMKDWYGEDLEFMEISHPEKGSAFVNVQGNRRISIYKSIDGRNVKVMYTDLLIEKELDAQKSKG